MAQRTSKKNPDIDRLLKGMIEEAVRAEIGRLFSGKASIEELRRLSGTMDRLEKRVEFVAAKLAGRRPDYGSGKGRPGRPAIHTSCTKPGCKAAHYAKGLCSKHYQQDRRAAAARKAKRANRKKKRR